MPLVIIQSSPLSTDQKKRIGERIIESLHSEGVRSTSVVVLFQPDQSDVYLDGGLVHELAAAPPAPGLPQAPAVPRELPAAQPASGDFRNKVRRSRQELGDLRQQLVSTLEDQGGLSSFQAQEALGLRDCDWAPATLRRLFGDLEEEGLIVKQGQKRGTRYVWKGRAANPPAAPMPRLVKRDSEDDAAGSEEQDFE